MQRGIVELIEPAARQHDGIDAADAAQVVLLGAEAFADDTFDAITLAGKTDVFLSYHKTQPGPFEEIGPGENQQLFIGDAQICGVEYLLKVGGRQ